MKRGLFLSGLAASFLCIGQLLHAGVPVRGNVSDTDNRPLIGVVVIEEGTANNAAVTDVSGNFEIEVKDSNASLVFSYIGYVPVTLKASAKMQVIMEPDISELDGVVVIGYGTS